MKVALNLRMEDHVGAALRPQRGGQGDSVASNGLTGQANTDAHPEPQDHSSQGDPSAPTTRHQEEAAMAVANYLHEYTGLARTAWGGVYDEHNAAHKRRVEQQPQQPQQPCESTRRPAPTRSGSAQSRTQSPRSYSSRAASPPLASRPRRPQTARASFGRTGQPEQTPLGGPTLRARPQTARGARAEPTTFKAARWVDIIQQRPSLIVA